MRHANFFSLTNFSSHFPYENGCFYYQDSIGTSARKTQNKRWRFTHRIWALGTRSKALVVVVAASRELCSSLAALQLSTSGASEKSAAAAAPPSRQTKQPTLHHHHHHRQQEQRQQGVPRAVVVAAVVPALPLLWLSGPASTAAALHLPLFIQVQQWQQRRSARKTRGLPLRGRHLMDI
jgi:hypothetical protein